jgi:uncharacterized membrane protein
MAWFLIVGWLTIRVWRESETAQFSFAVLLVAVSAPIWPVLWYAGWTEPLSLALLLGALLLWRAHPVASAILLGLMLASKQYFIFLAPLVLLHRDEFRKQRGAIVFSTIAITIVPYLLLDPGAYIQATITNLVDIGFRPDSQSLAGFANEWGFTFQLPPILWVGIGLAFTALISHRSHTPGDFACYSALGLGFAFAIGQSFPNYWWFVMGAAAIAAIIKTAEGVDRGTPQSEGEVRHSFRRPWERAG